MSPLKAELFKVLETAPESAVEQTLEYLKSLLPPLEFQPQSPLGKKLWEIRQRAINEGMTVLNKTEIAQELADGLRPTGGHRRGGYRDS
jgi:hypothetical protein